MDCEGPEQEYGDERTDGADVDGCGDVIAVCEEADEEGADDVGTVHE